MNITPMGKEGEGREMKEGGPQRSKVHQRWRDQALSPSIPNTPVDSPSSTYKEVIIF